MTPKHKKEIYEHKLSERNKFMNDVIDRLIESGIQSSKMITQYIDGLDYCVSVSFQYDMLIVEFMVQNMSSKYSPSLTDKITVYRKSKVEFYRELEHAIIKFMNSENFKQDKNNIYAHWIEYTKYSVMDIIHELVCELTEDNLKTN